MRLALRDEATEALPRCAFRIRYDEGEDEFVAVDAGLGDDLCVVAERIGFVDDAVICEPLLVAVFSPFGEVLLGNGSSVEALADDLGDFGFGVEPIDEFVCGFAFGEAIVEFILDFSGEIGDFAVAF